MASFHGRKMDGLATLVNELAGLEQFYLTGTGTEVGKTTVGQILATALLVRYPDFRPLKPVETGLEGKAVGPDTTIYLNVLKNANQRVKSSEICMYTLDYPCSPHLASEFGKNPVQVIDIIKFICQYDRVMIELAGGLRVPLNEQETQLDLIRQLPAPAVLVADAGLGTLNHAGLSIDALNDIGIPVFLVLNRYDASNRIHRSNLDYLAKRYSVWTLVSL